jgi:hypothetical protein
MGSEINFNANDVPPQTPFEPVPNGKYRAHIVDSEVKPTKDGRGKYLQLEWEILDGEYKGRKIWDRLNIVNPSETSQKIGRCGLRLGLPATRGNPLLVVPTGGGKSPIMGSDHRPCSRTRRRRAASCSRTGRSCCSRT